MKAIFFPDVPFESLYIPHILKEIYIDKVFAKVKPCDVIVDVGANIGLTVMYLRKFAKKVYAIEPSSEHFVALSDNLYYNEWRNVRIDKMAISYKTGHFPLFINDQNRTMNSLVWPQVGGSEKVFCDTFAGLMNSKDIETIDFCKLDVEGAEEDILTGEGFISVADRIKSLLVEIHYPSRVNYLLGHMTKLGYTWENVPADSILYWFERQ